ncbi:hypothetical protein ABT084_13025 [Streptomyces sp. NPDC002138]|uniref:hypothetical protein n=1 Tax=Streptomyces sp. NPDC002138 TaxID=3154410 RepID=UPI0033293461
MTQSGQGGDSRHPAEPPAYQPPVYEAPSYQPPAYGYPPQDAPPGHVLGPGYEGPGAPHGYGYPPIPEAETQYIPPVPAHPGPMEAATQYIPPVPGGPGPAGMEAATQYIPPVPAAPDHGEAATQYIPPVPSGQGPGPGPGTGSGPGMHEAATQYIPPVPAGQGPGQGPPDVFDGLFRGEGPGSGNGNGNTNGNGNASGNDQAHTQVLPPVPAAPRSQAPMPAPPFQQRRPKPQPQFPQQAGFPQQQPPYPQGAGFQQPPPPGQFPQAAPFQPPLPPEPARKVSPAVIGVAVLALAVVGLGVGSLLGDGKAQNNDPAAVDTAASKPAGSGSGSASPPADEAPVDPARGQAVQLDKVLADSNDSRAAVIRAVDDVKSCKNLGPAAEDLRDAARKREELVTKLQELKTDKLPDHAKLTAALTKAWKASGAADRSYAAWADEAASDRKTCKDGKAKVTGNANEADKSSGEATKSKESAATMWNRIATQYSLTQRDKSQL